MIDREKLTETIGIAATLNEPQAATPQATESQNIVCEVAGTVIDVAMQVVFATPNAVGSMAEALGCALGALCDGL